MRFPRKLLDDRVARHAPDGDFAVADLRANVDGDKVLPIGREHGLRRQSILLSIRALQEDEAGLIAIGREQHDGVDPIQVVP